MSEPFGILNVAKPQWLSSRHAVNRVYRHIKPARAGHAGTLDPLATGVLIVCVGRATRLVPRIQAFPKTYRAIFLLCKRSNTDDVTGEIEIVDAATPTEASVRNALKQFIGVIQQRPPMFSAVHVDGQRAYKLARQGQTREIEKRPVTVHRIDLESVADNKLVLEIECGSGTYIRSIARDLGEVLGCGGLMSALVRTRIGPFAVEDAIDVEEVSREELLEAIQPAALAVPDLPHEICADDRLVDARLGRQIEPEMVGNVEIDQEVAMLDPDGQLIGIAKLDPATGQLQPKTIFHAIQ